MTKKTGITLGICLLFSFYGYGQSERIDSSRHQKKSIHIIGVQANALVKQIFNFGNANNAVNNPYLLTYTFINRKSKLGFDAGVGYTLNNTFENDGNTKKDNYINDLYFRLGILQMLPLNRRFTATFNLHILAEFLNSKTMTESDFGSQLAVINSTTTTLKYGLGPCMGLRYKISNRVFAGTEASYYFKIGNNKSSVRTTNTFNGQSQTILTESNNDLKQFMLNVPTAIYLAIRI
ncbi:MAG: hypothetical protein IT257_07205 [Chitinophagaceae bacterium]|nr:hypothetical protein [Chitinophagaceae bacterium]